MGCSHSINKNKLIFQHLDKIRNNNYQIDNFGILDDIFLNKKINLFNNNTFNTYSLFENLLTNAEIAYLYNNYSDVTKMKPVKKIKITEVLYLKSIQYDKKIYRNALNSLFYIEKNQNIV